MNFDTKSKKKFRSSLYRNSILLLVALPDFIAIIISTLIAYAARFPNVVAGKEVVPTINLINYKLILFLIAIGWFLFFIGSGVYRFSHSNLIAFNLSMVIKKSVAYFFFVGFISFIFKASFSRGVFLLMLTSGIGTLFIFRISIFLFILRPLILSKKISANLMIIGKNKNTYFHYLFCLVLKKLKNINRKRFLVCQCSLWKSDSVWHFRRLLQFFATMSTSILK